LEIVWSPLAVGKVGEIALRIAADKPMVADEWVEIIFEGFQCLLFCRL